MEAGSDTNVDVDKCHEHEYASRRDRDDLLFTQPEVSFSCFGDCPICFLPMPLDEKKTLTFPCCGKFICLGCIYAVIQRPCPFCRHPPALAPAQAETDAKLKRRAKANDPIALSQMGHINYSKGDYAKAFQYWTNSARLGIVQAHYRLSVLYKNGDGVEKDEKKRVFHLEEAAIAGHPDARYNLGAIEWNYGSKERAVKHFIIAANLGEGELSLKMLKQGYAEGIVSKEDFAAALRAYQAAADAMKSPQRDEAYENLREVK